MNYDKPGTRWVTVTEAVRLFGKTDRENLLSLAAGGLLLLTLSTAGGLFEAIPAIVGVVIYLAWWIVRWSRPTDLTPTWHHTTPRTARHIPRPGTRRHP